MKTILAAIILGISVGACVLEPIQYETVPAGYVYVDGYWTYNAGVRVWVAPRYVWRQAYRRPIVIRRR